MQIQIQQNDLAKYHHLKLTSQITDRALTLKDVNMPAGTRDCSMRAMLTFSHELQESDIHKHDQAHKKS